MFGGKGIFPRAMETVGADGMSCDTPVKHGSGEPLSEQPVQQGGAAAEPGAPGTALRRRVRRVEATGGVSERPRSPMRSCTSARARALTEEVVHVGACAARAPLRSVHPRTFRKPWSFRTPVLTEEVVRVRRVHPRTVRKSWSFRRPVLSEEVVHAAGVVHVGA